MRTLLAGRPGSILTCRCSLIYGNVRLTSNTMEGRSIRVVHGTFRVTNCARRRLTSHFDTLCRTFRFNTPPRTNVTPNISHVVVLLRSARAVGSIVMFPLSNGTHSRVLNTPDPIDRVRLFRTGITVENARNTIILNSNNATGTSRDNGGKRGAIVAPRRGLGTLRRMGRLGLASDRRGAVRSVFRCVGGTRRSLGSVSATSARPVVCITPVIGILHRSIHVRPFGERSLLGNTPSDGRSD